MLPVRCYTCGVVVGHLPYEARVAAGEHPRTVLDALGVHRMCCRRMFLSHVDLLRDQVEYPNTDVVLDESGTVLWRHCRRERTVSCD